MNQTDSSILYEVRDLGLIDYDKAYHIQQECIGQVLKGSPQKILLCEHPAVLTLGRLSDENNMLCSRQQIRDKGIKVSRIDRGGDVTLHSPGQLIVYPIFKLSLFGKDLRSYLRNLEQVAIDLLNDFAIVGRRNSGHTGVWVDEKKIVSIGIGVKKWIAFHGLGINVSTDLDLFSLIRPCGLDVRMTSMTSLMDKDINIEQVKESIIKIFSLNFGLLMEKSNV